MLSYIDVDSQGSFAIFQKQRGSLRDFGTWMLNEINEMAGYFKRGVGDSYFFYKIWVAV